MKESVHVSTEFQLSGSTMNAGIMKWNDTEERATHNITPCEDICQGVGEFWGLTVFPVPALSLRIALSSVTSR